MENSNSQLMELKEKISRKKQAIAVLDKTRELLETEQERLHQQDLAVNKEYEDVLRLEGRSLASIFHSFLGNKVEKLYKEREEYLAAKLKYEGHKETVAHLEEEIRKQEKQIREFGDPESAYEKLIQSKQDALKAKNDQEYSDIAARMESVYSKIIEIEEAISAGEKSLDGLSEAIHSMEKAETWGTLDILGGGLITTAVKHSHIDKAKAKVQEIEYLLKRFKRELQDVQSAANANLAVDISGFDKVIDIFFDNLIFDWVVQKRIHKSLDSLIATKTRVKIILTSLKMESGSSRKEYQLLKTGLNKYLEKA